MSNENRLWYNNTLGEKVVAALNKNRFSASYVKTAAEATETVLNLINPTDTVGIGGSWTVKEIGLLDELEKRGNTVFNHGARGLTPEQSLAIRRKELTSDVFLTGTNAVTLDGQLVNVDGSGNRVAAMIFGPKKVIVVVGINKIAKDIQDAYHRIQMEAAPMNNKRLNLPNPCTTTGICMDCQGPTRICNVTSIIRKALPQTPTHVIVVGESLGF